MAKQKKEKARFAKVLSIIADILFIPIIVLALICIVATFTAKANNRVPSIFGKSIVTVQSGSMEKEYYKNDVLVIESVENMESIAVGDDIAFYAPQKTHWVDDNGNSLVIIHRVLRIVYPLDEQGRKHRFFMCAGINGLSMDVANFEIVADGQQGDYYLQEGTNSCALAVTPAQKQVAKYVRKLVGIRTVSNDEELNNTEVESANSQEVQYICADDDLAIEGNYNYVVGKFSHKVVPFLGALINFSATREGIIVFVLIPTLILIALIVISMTKEYKRSKEEDSEENITIQQNMEYIKTANAISEADRTREEAENNKEETAITDDERAKKEVQDELALGMATGSVVSDLPNEEGELPKKKIPTKKSKPITEANDGTKNAIAEQAAGAVPLKRTKPKRTPLDNENQEAQHSLPKKIPVKKVKEDNKTKIKKIPRNRAQAWKMSIDNKNNTDKK